MIYSSGMHSLKYHLLYNLVQNGAPKVLFYFYILIEMTIIFKIKFTEEEFSTTQHLNISC